MKNFPEENLNQIQSLKCPKCNSENTSSLEMAHKNGIKQTEPPVPKSFGTKDFIIATTIAFGVFTLGGVVIGFISALIGFGSGFSEILSLLLTVIAPLAYILNRKQNISRHNVLARKNMLEYRQSWLCLRCGTIWIPRN